MAIIYSLEELKYLRDSPLVVKPPSLPPAELWMGPSTEPARIAPKLPIDRPKSHDSTLLLDQNNQRPVVERHSSRNSANPVDIILGPPKTSFMSATSMRSSGKPFDSAERSTLREADPRDRYHARGKVDGESDRLRDGRSNTLRPKRTDGEPDSDGWSTVKPRKSFGAEGAERFNGRMGVDRYRDDKRFRDREDRESKERSRGFDTYSRDRDIEQEQERDTRRSGTGRGRNEPTWREKDTNDVPPVSRDRNSNGDRFVDRNRGWREKDRDDQGDKAGDRLERGDRRWDKDRNERRERMPEWINEPAEEKIQARTPGTEANTQGAQVHTQEDFQKWKEQFMQGKDKGGAAKSPVDEGHFKIDAGASFFGLDKQGGAAKSPVDEGHFKIDAGASFFGLDKPKVETPLPLETGPDKFFGMWATPKDQSGPEPGAQSEKEGLAKAKTAGKASRFTSLFFNSQEEVPRRQTEPPPAMPMRLPPPNGFEILLQNNSQSSAEKEAFQQLLQKLQRQTVSGPGLTPPSSMPLQLQPPAPERQQNNTLSSPESFQQHRSERHEEGRPSTRNSQQALQDLLHQRQVAGSQPLARGPEQMLQELVGQRQNALSQSSVRPEQPLSRNNNTEFLMGLMQSARAAPEPQRTEMMLLRNPPGHERQMQHQIDQEMQNRNRSGSQRRPGPPPGFFEDPSFHRGPPPQERQGGNPTQPTQILQRPLPPGLEMGWGEQTTQLPPQQHRINQNLPPAPGLVGGPNRGMPLPQQQQMFPPGFHMGNFPPPDAMAGPPRNMMHAPPGFFGVPPPGFLPPPGMAPNMAGFQGPDNMAFGGPFEGRGPPPGGYRRQ